MKVKLNGREWQFEVTSVWGPMYDFETLTQNKMTYNPASAMHNHIMFYGILIRCNKEFDMDFESFVQSLNDVEAVKAMTKYYKSRLEILTTGAKATDEELSKKKDGA